MPGQPERPEPEKPLGELGAWFQQVSKLFLAGLILMVIGLFGGLLAGDVIFWLLFVAGLSLLAIWAYQAGLLPRVLGKEQVLDQWYVLIGNGQGRVDNIFQDTQTLITQTKAPDIQMERQSLAPSLIRGILGSKREFLVVRNNTNHNLRTYQMYVNARDYGNNLQVSWYLVTRLGFWRTLLARVFFFASQERQPETLVADLDLFDLQDLTAYVTNAHHCLLEAVEKLMIDLHQDPSKIERKSRGFLGIS